MQQVPFTNLCLFFVVAIVIGLALLLPIYKFDWRKLARSKLFIKTLLWFPIFIFFIILLYLPGGWQLALLALMLAAALVEIFLAARNKSQTLLAVIYASVFTWALMHFVLIGLEYPNHLISLLVTICLASAISDVTAFFFGSYFGNHKLPKRINDSKSWEGVAGQIIGALIGVILVNQFIIPVWSIWLFLPIGIGNACGDILNSYVKRQLGIKDWSRALPGHGGLVDRLSSLAGAALLSFYYLKFF